jgi:hypothetical protein
MTPLVKAPDGGGVLLCGGSGNTLFSDLWAYTNPIGAEHTAFGQGCPGSAGTPQLAPVTGQRPWLSGRIGYAVDSAMPSTIALLMQGFSRTQYRGVPLPFDLGVVGAPGCNLWVAAEFLHAVSVDPFGRGSVTIQVPGDPSLVGLLVFYQFTVFDVAANALGLSFSQGGESRLGVR